MSYNKLVGCIASVLGAVLAAAPLQTTWAQSCVRQWMHFPDGDLSNTVRASAIFDDGSGEALYLGGEFLFAGHTAANNIVKWDGRMWSTLGSGMNSRVYALLAFDDNSGNRLYAAGDFSAAGGQPASRVARWDGQSWEPMGELSASMRAIATFNDGAGTAIYAAGGGPGGAILVRWDGLQWQTVATGTGTISSLLEYDGGSGPALFLGGRFTQIGGVSVNHIASWDGVQWDDVGAGASCSTGCDAKILTMALHDGRLVVGGSFSHLGGAPAQSLGAWDGQSWASLPALLTPEVRALHSSAMTGKLYAAAFNVLAVLESGTWTNFGPNSVETLTEMAAVGGSTLFAGGSFTNAGAVSAPHIAAWDGEQWSGLGSGLNGPVAALITHDDGSGEALFIGGSFSRAAGRRATKVARWNGDHWSAAGEFSGTNSHAMTDFALFDGVAGRELYASSSGQLASQQTVFAWNGAGWSGIGGGPVAVFAVTGHQNASGNYLYASQHISGFPVRRWNGASWQSLSSNPAGALNDLASFDAGQGSQLFAAGTFTAAGTILARNIATWDGTSWSSVGQTGLSGGTGTTAHCLHVGDLGSGPSLYAGGRFSHADTVSVRNIARWDGTAWAPLAAGGPGSEGTDGTVRAIVIFDDGDGPALYAGGEFTSAGGIPALGIARWDGQSWAALGDGVAGHVYALASFDDGRGIGLYVGGQFSQAGGQLSSNFARWGCSAPPAPPCYANCDSSTTPPILNVDDFTCFINEFAAAQALPHEQQITAYANCDDSTVAPALNVDDFTCFINEFAQGCP